MRNLSNAASFTLLESQHGVLARVLSPDMITQGQFHKTQSKTLTSLLDENQVNLVNDISLKELRTKIIIPGLASERCRIPGM